MGPAWDTGGWQHEKRGDASRVGAEIGSDMRGFFFGLFGIETRRLGSSLNLQRRVLMAGQPKKIKAVSIGLWGRGPTFGQPSRVTVGDEAQHSPALNALGCFFFWAKLFVYKYMGLLLKNFISSEIALLQIVFQKRKNLSSHLQSDWVKLL